MAMTDTAKRVWDGDWPAFSDWLVDLIGTDQACEEDDDGALLVVGDGCEWLAYEGDTVIAESATAIDPEASSVAVGIVFSVEPKAGKACVACGVIKPLDAFSHSDTRCKACAKERSRESARVAQARQRTRDLARHAAVKLVLERHNDEFLALYDEAKREAGL